MWNGIYLHVFITWTLDCGELSQLHFPTVLPPEEDTSVRIGGWMGPRAGLSAVPLPGIVPRFLGDLAHSTSLYRLSYRGSLHCLYRCACVSGMFTADLPTF
jgi:hypothetical protein